MTSKIRNMLDYYIVRKEHHKFRQEEKDPYRYAEDYLEKGLGDLERSVCRLRDVLSEEVPVVMPDESIAFMRTVAALPEIFTEEEFSAIKKRALYP